MIETARGTPPHLVAHRRAAALLVAAALGALLCLTQPAHASGHGDVPTAWTLLGAEIDGDSAIARWHVDWDAYGRLDVDEVDLEAANRAVLDALGPDGVRSARLLARPYASSDWRDLVELLAPLAPPPLRPWEAQPDAPARRHESAEAAPAPALIGHALPGEGALSGKTVYLSPGHGLYWSTTLGRWATQRGNTHNIVEDFVNAEGALHYLEALLRAAGAQVIGVRELDHQVEMVVVDDGDGMTASAGGYQDDGGWKAGASAGFASGKAPYTGTQNPFALGGYRYAPAVMGAPTATATFVPKVPKDGAYRVTIGWTSGANRVKDAHIEVRHAGGVSHFRVDQSRHGQSWWPLGTFHFRAGVNPLAGAVLVLNDTLGDASGKVVVADVVRLGGGMGEIVRGNGSPPAKGPTTHRPRWESAARYYTQYAGAPPAVWDSSAADNNDDVTSRSRFAGWHHEKGDDAAYLSWHSNAPDPGRGTSTYVYGPNPPNGSKDYKATKGSVELGGWLQKTLVADIRAEFDPSWKDRGLYSAYFGEVNPSHNPDMPAALVEAAFHSTLADADYLREPRFRFVLARAMTKAIIRYFAERDGKVAVIPPEAPVAVVARATAAGGVEIDWKPGASGGAAGDAATAYLVETSADGFAFTETTEAKAPPLLLAAPAPKTPLFVRVRARNAGGTSLPTATFGVAVGCAQAARALAVQGFSRLQASQLPVDDLSPWSLGKVQRLRQWRVNRFDYLIAHVSDLAAAGVGVDSADRAAFGEVDLAPYSLVDWAAGEQSTTDHVLDKAERAALSTWLDGDVPRALLLSGSEVGWALGAKGDASSADWLATWLGAKYADDDADTYALAPSAGAALAWGGGTFDDGEAGTYDVDWPDAFELVGGTALLDYAGGKGGVAAVRYQVGKATTALIGVPLETVVPAKARTALIAALVDSLGVDKVPGACPSAGGDDAGGADAGSADAGGVDAGSADAGGVDAGGHDDAGGHNDATDAGGVDAGQGAGGADGRAGLDGGVAADGGVDAGLPANAAGAPPAGGCGCQIHGRAAPDAGAGALLVGLLGLLLAMRRRIAVPRART